MAMDRETWHAAGVLAPIAHVFTGGFELPALTTLSRMEMFRPWVTPDVSPIPLFALAAVLIWLIWTIGPRLQHTLSHDSSSAPTREER
jgi:hypothetical protein